MDEIAKLPNNFLIKHLLSMFFWYPDKKNFSVIFVIMRLFASMVIKIIKLKIWYLNDIITRRLNNYYCLTLYNCILRWVTSLEKKTDKLNKKKSNAIELFFFPGLHWANNQKYPLQSAFFSNLFNQKLKSREFLAEID